MALNFIKESITIGADKITDKTFTFFKQGFRLNGAIGEPEYRDVTVSGVNVLTLPNAEADGLNYCKLYGKCEQRDLPEGYTEVEYLQSSGTQWIDTGVNQQNGDEFGLVYQQITLDSSYRNLFGAATGGSTGSFYISQTSSATYVSNTSNSNIPRDTNKHILSWVTTSSSSQNIVVDGQTYVSSVQVTPNPNLKVMVFARNAEQGKMIGKVYGYYQKRNGEYLINLIPARRNSDSVLGMYDTVTGNFLTNAGTGTFTAGNDVVPTPTRPLNIICNNGVVKVSPNLFNKNGQYIAGFVNSDTGILSASTEQAQQRSFVIPCLPNTTYVLQGMTANSTWGSFTSSTIGTRATSYTTGNATLTTGSNDKYLIGLAYTASGLDYRNTLQIEAGTTATAYMPYGIIYTDGTVETVKDSLNNSATAEMLLAVNDYKDVQEVLTGNVTRNFAIKVLNGTESWVYQAEYSRFNTAIGNMKPGIRDTAIACTHYQAITDGREITNVPNNSIYSITSATRISIKTDQYTSVDTFTSFLQQQYANGTPVIVVYPLATPTTSTVTAQTLTTQEGTNTIEITQASLTGLPIEVNYMAGVSVTVQQIENANLDNQVTVTIGE